MGDVAWITFTFLAIGSAPFQSFLPSGFSHFGCPTVAPGSVFPTVLLDSAGNKHETEQIAWAGFNMIDLAFKCLFIKIIHTQDFCGGNLQCGFRDHFGRAVLLTFGVKSTTAPDNIVGGYFSPVVLAADGTSDFSAESTLVSLRPRIFVSALCHQSLHSFKNRFVNDCLMVILYIVLRQFTPIGNAGL